MRKGFKRRKKDAKENVEHILEIIPKVLKQLNK